MTAYNLEEFAMSITTFTSREFNRSVSRAKNAADLGPVFITNRSEPKHVLLSIAEYNRLKGERISLVDALAMPGLSEIEFEPPRARIESAKVKLC